MLGFKGLRKLRLKEVHSGDLSQGLRFKMKTPGRGGTLGISGWGCATTTLEPSTYTRASSAKFCYPILE